MVSTGLGMLVSYNQTRQTWRISNLQVTVHSARTYPFLHYDLNQWTLSRYWLLGYSSTQIRIPLTWAGVCLMCSQACDAGKSCLSQMTLEISAPWCPGHTTWGGRMSTTHLCFDWNWRLLHTSNAKRFKNYQSHSRAKCGHQCSSQTPWTPHSDQTFTPPFTIYPTSLPYPPKVEGSLTSTLLKGHGEALHGCWLRYAREQVDVMWDLQDMMAMVQVLALQTGLYGLWASYLTHASMFSVKWRPTCLVGLLPKWWSQFTHRRPSEQQPAGRKALVIVSCYYYVCTIRVILILLVCFPKMIFKY